MPKSNVTPKELDRYLREVTASLEALPPQRPDSHYDWSAVPVLGLSVPQARALAKRGYSFHSLPRHDLLDVWEHVWRHGTSFEVKSQPLFHYEKRREVLDRHETTVVAQWVDGCDNWAHSDILSSIYARALEAESAVMLPILQAWNGDEHPWKRRQSVVGLMYYACMRRRFQPFEVIAAHIEHLLDDDHYYVQKGVGWALRECYNVYPDQALAFIRRHVARIPAVGWQAASEKLPAAVKKELTARRKVRPAKPALAV